jgi:predicted nucleic acid-binding protein
MDEADNIIVSIITKLETHSTFKRLVTEKAISDKDYKTAIKEFENDYQYFTHISIDDVITAHAKYLIEKHQLKTLDSIQLGSAISLKDEIDYFVVCDFKLIKSGKKEGLKVINPIS